MPGSGPDGLTHLGSELLQVAHRGILTEDHAPVLLRINLQRVTVTDNIDTENLVLVVFGGLDQCIFAIFRAGIKIYGDVSLVDVEQGVHIAVEPDLQPILEYVDALYQQF